MKITFEIIENRHSLIETDVKCLLLICFLYENKAITKERYSGMMSSLRKGTFQKIRKTYHCNILDKWYSNVSMVEVLEEICFKTNSTKDLSIDTLIKHTNVLFSKNKNYCINYIFFNIIKPVLSHYNGKEYENYKLSVLGIEGKFDTFEKIENYLSCGFCCEDCDGPYEDYIEYRYKFDYLDPIRRQIESYVENFLISKRHNHEHSSKPNFKIF